MNRRRICMTDIINHDTSLTDEQIAKELSKI